MKKIFLSLAIIFVLTGVAFANFWYPRNIINLDAFNAPLDTLLETEVQLNGTKLMAFHALSDGNNGLKDKEVRVDGVHIVYGTGVVAPASSGLQGDGNFYVQDGAAFFNGRVIKNQVRIESSPRLVLGAANHNVVILSSNILTISSQDWWGGSVVTLRFRDANKMAHLGPLDPNDPDQIQVKFKDGLSHKFNPGSTLELVLDIDQLSGEKFWYEI